MFGHASIQWRSSLWQLPSVLWHCWLGGSKGIRPIKNIGGSWRWALVSLDGVAPSRMVSVSASVNLPLHRKVQNFSSGTGSTRWSRKKGRKMVCVCLCHCHSCLTSGSTSSVRRLRRKSCRTTCDFQWVAVSHAGIELTVLLLNCSSRCMSKMLPLAHPPLCCKLFRVSPKLSTSHPCSKQCLSMYVFCVSLYSVCCSIVTWWGGPDGIETYR